MPALAAGIHVLAAHNSHSGESSADEPGIQKHAKQFKHEQGSISSKRMMIQRCMQSSAFDRPARVSLFCTSFLPPVPIFCFVQVLVVSAQVFRFRTP